MTTDFLNRAKLLSWAKKMFSFFLGQGAMQLLGLATGLLILRWMSIESYAQYSVAFGFQTSVGMLVDLGFSGAVIALVGARVSDPTVIGRYIRTVLHFRTVLFAIALPVGAVGFVWITGRQHWSWPVRGALFASIMFTLFFQGWTSYGSALVMHQRYGDYYRSQFSSGVFRLATTALFHFLSMLSAVATAWINAIAMALMGTFFRHYARPYVQEPPRADAVTNREMIRYVGPTVPPTIFGALEGQITLFLITWFGRSHNIAEVAALGRLTQALIILMAFNGIIVIPYIARLPRAQLAGRYALFLGGGCLVAGGLWGLSVIFPAPLLWVMGPKYQHLTAELPWSIGGWGLYYLGTLMWAMHSARKWVFWWHTSLYCGVLIASQVLGVWLFELGTTLGILHFAFLGAGANLLVQIAGGIYGFWTEKVPRTDSEPSLATIPDPAVAAIWAEEGVVPSILPVETEL